jgi:hypothetical protein
MQETGLECYRIASGPGSSTRERDLALFQLSLRMKRLGKWEEAVPIWLELIRRGETLVVECCLEMAKYYEHRAKEVDLAIQMVEFALVRAKGGRAPVEADLRRRLERLTRKRGEAWEG